MKIEISRNNDDTTGNLLDYFYHQKCYKLTGIDLSRETNTSVAQQINFVRKLEKDDAATKLLLLKNSKKLF